MSIQKAEFFSAFFYARRTQTPHSHRFLGVPLRQASLSPSLPLRLAFGSGCYGLRFASVFYGTRPFGTAFHKTRPRRIPHATYIINVSCNNLCLMGRPQKNSVKKMRHFCDRNKNIT